MDPHSRRSQFNQRAPKSGPPTRNVELIHSQKVEQPKMPPKKGTTSTHVPPDMNILIRRPIATNSRVKQDEIFKRDMYLSFVTNALEQKSNGLSDSFDELVSQFNTSSTTSSNQHTPPIDTAQIRLWLLALSHVVSRLERTHAALVDAIVNMPWTTFDGATVKSYTVFTGVLLSARPEYLSLVLAKIAHGFTYQSGVQALDSSMPSASTSPLTRRVVYDRLHYLLKHVLTLIPTLPSTLQPLLVRYFPHKRQNQIIQTTYIRNLLRVSTYCPELADKILATIVDRAIQIDVEIQIELEELEEEEPDDHDVFELDPFDFVLGQEPSLDSDNSDSENDDAGDLDDFDSRPRIEVPMNVQHIQEMVKKLDAILFLLFEHFSQTKAMNDVKDNDNTRTALPSKLPPLPPLETRSLTPIEWGPSINNSLNFDGSLSPASTNKSTTNTRTPSETTTKHSDSMTTLRSQFHSLLSIFDRIILRTFKSRYTQFLIFWYASLDPEFSDIYQGMLVDRALMTSASDTIATHSNDSPTNARAHSVAPELTRAAAASYIGSFVSRATFVDREGTRRVVSILCEYLKTHLDTIDYDLYTSLDLGSTLSTSSSNAHAATVVGAILASGQHTVFYAIVQAVFLIFCFRWRDLIGEESELDIDELDISIAGRIAQGNSANKGKWMPELSELKRAVASILNPLKVCSENVVTQFARVAQATDFLYCYPRLEMNKRGDLSIPSFTSSTASNTTRSTRSNEGSTTLLNNTKTLYEPVNAELNTFFPFDPYRLPKSNVYIQGVYREWASVAIDDDEDEDEHYEENEDGFDQLADDRSSVEFGRESMRSVAIPKDKTTKPSNANGDDEGLGASLNGMSISPARMMVSVSVDMR